MGDGASLFFKNEGPLFFGFILLISILLNVFIEVSVMIRIQKLQKSQIQIKFFLLQSGLLHAQQGDRGDGDGVAWSAGAEGHGPLQLFTLLIELLRQARVLLRTHTQATYTSMYVGKTATATPWYNIAMECAAVATMMMLNLSAGTMYLSHLRCMATTM